MDKRICIPDNEYQERIQKAAALAAKKGLDVLIVNSTESDFANVRYFSRFWPLFERAGVAISPSGDAALMVGPESRIFAADVSKIQNIFVLMEYRESADPAYPETKTDSYRDVLKSLGISGEKLRIGIGGYIETTAVMIDGLKANFPQAEIVRADDIMIALRSVKSENELACLREAFRITNCATKAVMEKLRPGVTELQMVGVAQQSIYENGAEYEGLPMYVFSELSTRHAISRPSYRVINKGDIVQLNLSARVDGYSPSIGFPVCMGKLTPEKREAVEFCLAAHRFTEAQLKAGVVSASIAKSFYQYYVDQGKKSWYIYGPCHGLGMMEVEAPWMETISDYLLKPNMTFQVDTFVSTPHFGLRFEKGVTITENGYEPLSEDMEKIIELEF